MNHRTARALFPHRPEMWPPEFVYEPLPFPDDHPELDLFGIDRMARLQSQIADSESQISNFKSEIPNAPPAPEFQISNFKSQIPNAPPAPESQISNFKSEIPPAPLPARMLNEFVYCPRLFYYEHVEGVFVRNADTERGSALHEKIDRGKGALLRAKKTASTAAPPSESEIPPEISDPKSEIQETIHSRSAMLSSERLGVVAKMDLIEVNLAPRAMDDLFAPRVVDSVTPVDYKAGAPKLGQDENELWDADKMQLGLQILILRDNGYTCDSGVIYYRATKQRVPLQMTPELETWIIDQIAKARLTSAGQHVPPPLVHSPKCVRCSLAPVCLPDETRMLCQPSPPQPRSEISNLKSQIQTTSQSQISNPKFQIQTTSQSQISNPKFQIQTTSQSQISNPKFQIHPPRRLMAARDDERALYLNTQGCRIGIKSERLVIKDGDTVMDEVRLNDVSQISLFGNIQVTTQAIHELCEQEIPLAYFSMGGWFYGLTRGHGLKNVTTRIRQFAAAANPVHCLEVAKKIVRAKIRNHRTLLMRLHVQPPSSAVVGMKEIAARVIDARGLDELLGMEGAAAALYFQHFAGMIKIGEDDLDDEIPGLEDTTATDRKRKAETEAFTFDFTHRRRRPPTDPVNALLSLAYSLLAKDCTIAALACGFDPYVGFYHQPRHGRPALALDLMEEFRPLIAESAVLTAINNRMVQPGHFVRAGEAVNLTPHGRKAFFHAYEQRMNSLITHPVFDYKVSYRRVLELQARLMARWLTGEIPDYIPMVTR
jgi:CRISP-associated protein Cas1